MSDAGNHYAVFIRFVVRLHEAYTRSTIAQCARVVVCNTPVYVHIARASYRSY